jgi:hypothetical protein
MKHTQAGQVMVETLIVAAALAVALLLPYAHGQSVASLLLESLLDYLRAESYLLSIL